MEYMKPDYYSKFRCAASECPETCCAGWKIEIDKKTLNKYKMLEGKFRNRLHNAVKWEKMEFCQYEGKCELLNEDGLCSLHAELGEEMLCDTCKRYPRHVEAFENRREYSLSLSCPCAAEMILGREEPVRFLTHSSAGGQEYYRNYDRKLFSCLLAARDTMIRILQDRRIKIAVRLQTILALGHDLQQRIDRKKYGKITELLERYRSPGSVRYFESQKWKYAGREKKALEIAEGMEQALSGMETVCPSWEDYLKKVKMGYAKKTDVLKKIMSGDGVEDEMQNLQEIQKMGKFQDMQNKSGTALEQLAIYFLQVYFSGSVYDKNAYSKVKFSVMSTVWIAAMAAGTEVPQFAELVQAAFRYAREMEHSDVNLLLTEEKLMYHEIFSFENIMIYTYHILES